MYYPPNNDSVFPPDDDQRLYSSKQQPPFHNQPTQQGPIYQPGYYNQGWKAPSGASTGHSGFSVPQSPQDGMPGTWWKRQTRATKLGLGCGTIIVLLLMCSVFSYAIGIPGGGPTTPPTATPTQQQVAQISSTETPTQDVATPPATLPPTPTPTPVPTKPPAPTPTPIPTKPPAPTPTPQPETGVNGNPWGYDFNPGTLITNPPTNFCQYFGCIGSFWDGKGYVIECKDGMYSKSGGRSGSCSHHGGNSRILYAH
jgi:hypothetical protein